MGAVTGVGRDALCSGGVDVVAPDEPSAPAALVLIADALYSKSG